MLQRCLLFVLNQLTRTATAYDYWAPIVGARNDEGGNPKGRKRSSPRVGRPTNPWCGALHPTVSGQAVEVALGIASLVYGGLWVPFALGVFTKRPGQVAVIIG
ncbi:MAG: hypothetical protein CM1200mP14_23470 [Gammaproteobacteria bacterium]|nr:MAG: hypothetical protein CM1200mP14_23470 [Gammaproteobacteria bacterium]